jgi:hypothetical protein
MGTLRRLAATLRTAFLERKDAAIAAHGGDAGATSGAVSTMKDLKAVYRWKDVEQVSLVLREMRVWDEDGVPDLAAAEFGEFVIKVRAAASLQRFRQAVFHVRQHSCFLKGTTDRRLAVLQAVASTVNTISKRL